MRERPVRVVERPTRLGSVLSVGIAVGAVALFADGRTQRFVVGVELVGLVVLSLGVVAWRRDGTVADGLLAFAGAGLALGAFGLVGVLPLSLGQQLELLPGMVGIAVLTLGVVPIRASRARTLVTAGTACIVVGVLTSGVLYGVSRLGLLAALAASVIAWDVAERAINLGEQVGKRADTTRVELAGAGGSLAIGAGAIGIALGIDAAGPTGLPLVGLALLLVAGITIAVALHN